MIEKRKEPRIPVQLDGFLKEPDNNQLKRCKIKNLSLHGALIFFDEPLEVNKKVNVQIKDNGSSYEAHGTVRWCGNGSWPFKIGLSFYEPINVRLPLKEISSALLKGEEIEYGAKYVSSPLFSRIYVELLKESSRQLHIGYMCFFLKNKIMNLFETINTEFNLIDLAVKKVLKINNKLEISDKDISMFYNHHFNSLNVELKKIENFIKILNKQVKDSKSYKMSILHMDKILNSIIYSCSKKISLFKEVEFTSNISRDIKSFIGNKYILEQAIEMIFTFHINYILFYNANKIKVYLTYMEPQNRILLKIINNGSKMFNENIELNKNVMGVKDHNNIFVNYLKVITIILEEYDPEVKILNESGNNHFILSFCVEPII